MLTKTDMNKLEEKFVTKNEFHSAIDGLMELMKSYFDNLEEKFEKSHDNLSNKIDKLVDAVDCIRSDNQQIRYRLEDHENRIDDLENKSSVAS